MGELTGRVALVTGAARGIGRGIASGLAAAGCDVALLDLGEGANDALTYDLSGRAELEATAHEISELGVRTLAVPCDVRHAAEVEAAFERATAELGGLDILVNNAGVVHMGGVDTLTPERWDFVFDVNVKGTFLCSRAALPHLVRRKGTIVNISSVAGKRGYPGGAAYCASKFAVVGLTQSLAAEFAPSGVRVNAVCPGILATHMWTHHLAAEDRGGRAAYEASVERMIPLGREQTAEDVAGAVLYLVSAPNVTGVSLNVAGGMETN
jgi:meso-butanediol dehydrogenase/(S,S)-butanediol dehydrogenase/diacetyl reductase